MKKKQQKAQLNIKSLKKNHKEFIKNNKLILKSQQRFKSKKQNLCTEEVNKNTLSANNDKRIQSVDSIEAYAYGTGKYLVCKKEAKCNNVIKECKKSLQKREENNVTNS